MKCLLIVIAAIFFVSAAAFSQDDILATLQSLDEMFHALEVSREILIREDLENIPSGMPCLGCIVSPFGFRIDPFTNRITHHNGIDISNETGTPIRVTGGGVVIFAGLGFGRGYSGYGKIVVVEHSSTVITMYAHLNIIKVEVGDTVIRGEVVGRLGNTGRSTGPHLHYEVRVRGTPVDPEEWM
jgi:murein DD-endopeptidase MepM/ murein hydrolase activator NlpD